MGFTLKHDIVVQGRSVRLRLAGTGRPLVMIHDVGSSAASFVNLLGDVVAHGRMPIAMDLPGVGHSDPLHSTELRILLDHVDDVLRDISDVPMDVIGRGFGGYLALTLAAREPTRCEHLVVIDPLVPADSSHPAPWRMRPDTAARGALSTLRGGRLKQNLLGYGRARAVLRQLSRPDDEWWSALAGITAATMVTSDSARGSLSRQRAEHLSATLRSTDTRHRYVIGDAPAAAVLGFLSS